MLHMPAALRCRAVGACLARLLALLLALLVGVTSPVRPAVGQQSGAQEPGTQEALVRQQISEDAAVAMVRKETDGKVVRVDRLTEGGALVYQIRVLSPDGRLREFRVDATTGLMR
jgi:hypothetical protein